VISDIRVNVLLRRHRKRRRLEKLIGPGAVGYLIDLWIATAVSRPDGVLSGWGPVDIAEEVDWTGDPEELIGALIESGFVDRREDGVVIVHDWMVHQGWASGSSSRSNVARLKALIRHHGEEAAFRLAREKYGFEPGDYGFVLRHKSADADADAAALPEHATALQQHDSAHATAMQRQCSSMPKHKSADAAALPLHDSAHAGRFAPSPSPSPLPPLKDGTKVPSGQAAGQTKKKHFTKKATEYGEEIKAVCKKVTALSNGSGRFNPYQWAQKWINKNGHPQAVIDSLEGLHQFWGELRGSPWAYADAIMKTRNGNYNERDEQTRAAGYKKIIEEIARIVSLEA
jgi:hypothetical protein